MKKQEQIEEVLAPPSCTHCGEHCDDEVIRIDEDKVFCCNGCKMVFEILNENDLCKYYEIDENAAFSLKGKKQTQYAYLDDPDVQARLVDFSDGQKTRITFHLPAIHCASCIWLLENLYKLNEGVTHSKVNFLKKEIYITYLENQTSLRQVVEMLDSIAYPPSINLNNLDDPREGPIDRSFYYKLGLAGFAFGNIMLLSFPEYLGLGEGDSYFKQLFGYLNILLATPVLLYSGRDYLQSAWIGLSKRHLNIDVPISLGIIALYGRSVFEILSATGAGYMDSLAGLIFFLLIGKWFQQKTYHHLSFERDYKSYFPVAATIIKEGVEKSLSLDKLEVGDDILIKNEELIPADGVLKSGSALIDYSFVTGEEKPVEVKLGDKLFAGGRQKEQTIEMTLTRKVSQSYLTQLWNDDAFTTDSELPTSRLADMIGRRFTIVILIIAFSTLFYWLRIDYGIAFNAFTSVLIIACPCAVALSIPFTLGNVIRILARNRFYLKHTGVIENIREITTVVFDKTGTLTSRIHGKPKYQGLELSDEDKYRFARLALESSHPASVAVRNYFQTIETKGSIEQFKESVGQGIVAEVEGKLVKIGSAGFIGLQNHPSLNFQGNVYLSLDNMPVGAMEIESSLRGGIEGLMNYFKTFAKRYLLSGDIDREKTRFQKHFDEMIFEQTPENKLNFIKELQEQSANVMMIGDGLNDAGALKQSEVGIVVTENTNNFTPASDAILHADEFNRLSKFLEFSVKGIKLVFYAYGFAFLYNLVGLSYAVSGNLSPVIAAILMPLSSTSIVLFGVISSNLLGRKYGL